MISSNISSICSHNMVNVGLLMAEISSRLGFVTAPTSLNGGQSNFAGCLAVSWASIHYIYIFMRSCPLTDFCQLQNSLYVRVLHSPILPALLHSTRAAVVSRTLWRGIRNGITKLSQRAPPIFGWVAIALGIGPHSSYVCSTL